MNYNNKEELKEKMKGNIFIIWFIISMSAIVFFADLKPIYSVIAFGQLLLCFVLAMPKDKGTTNFIKPIFMLVGLGSVVIPLIYIFSEMFDIDKEAFLICAIAFAGLSLFTIVGLGLIVLPIRKRKKLKDICNVSVNAIVVRNNEMRSNNKTLYCPIYSYEFDEKHYEVSNNIYSNIGIKEVGSIVELKINPLNPEEFLIDKKIEGDLIAYIFIGISFLIPPVICLIFLFSGIISN